eukprot:CAMPEP_0194567932 /NCGR_PEP_ID=MMETSP0292-20121207/6231_1 /TAXON_ID=39354 /ORGANISM="Heterosigma akashiwo, Strain CCMP2393" /LENGTH=66 /DNA_ID=CAMNT_0039417843 /DNA_START=139 /DNA_END=335 /DNA_ORIENTATION=+
MASSSRPSFSQSDNGEAAPSLWESVVKSRQGESSEGSKLPVSPAVGTPSGYWDPHSAYHSPYGRAP